MFCTTAVFKFNCLYKTFLDIYQEHKKYLASNFTSFTISMQNVYVSIGGDGYHVDSGAGDISYEQLQAIIESLVVKNGYYQTAT